MKTLTLCTFITLALFSFGQNVGINGTGNTPDNSAGLDVSFTDKGLLIPRVSLSSNTDVVTIPSPATSLLVYNTATAGVAPGNVVPGFYYWDGAAWVKISNHSGKFVDGVNPNDAVYTNGNVGIGTTTPVAKCHIGPLGVSNALFIGDTVGWHEDLGAIFTSYENGSAVLNLVEYDDPFQIKGINVGDTAVISMFNGNIGINRTNPSQKLDVNGKVKITDGSEQSGYVLTSDASGVGTWKHVTDQANSTSAQVINLNAFADGDTIFHAGQFADIGTVQLTEGTYMYFIYNCPGQLSYASGWGNNIGFVAGTASISTVNTWANLNTAPSGGCGHLFTGVIKVSTGGSAKLRMTSYINSALVKNGATAFRVEVVKIL